MVDKSEQISNLAAALLKAQTEIGTVLKNAENPFFHSMYANFTAIIAAVKGPLNNNGIAFLQAVDMGAKGNGEHGLPVVDTILLHESGQYISTRTPVYCLKANDPQALGTGITYSKRYALQAILGLPTEDDDGEGAKNRNGKPRANAKKNAKANKPAKDTKDFQKIPIIDQAYFEYTTVHQDKVPKGFVFSAEKFQEAIKKRHDAPFNGALPTTKESIPVICEQIPPDEVWVKI